MTSQDALRPVEQTKDSPVAVERASGVARVTLNRPWAVNALTLEMLRHLVTTLEQLESDPDIGVVVLSGAGRGFNSGWDRGPSGAADSPEDVLANDDLGRQVMEVLAGMRTFTLARLHGAAVGGGVLLAAACDFRIASGDAFFWLPEISFGNPLLWTGLTPLAREIGVSRARYLAMSNRRVDAQWALAAGLVHEVVDTEGLDARVEELTGALLDIPPRGVRLMKEDLERVAAHLPRHHGHSALAVYESLTADTFAPANRFGRLIPAGKETQVTDTDQGPHTGVRAPSADAAAIRQTVDAVRAEPRMGQVTFRMSSRPAGELRARTSTGALTQGGQTDASRAGRFDLTSDEPAALLGTDAAVSPAEYALKALAGCYTVTLASLAATRGIHIDAMDLELEFDIDLNGFLGIDKTVRKGASQIRVAIGLHSKTASREELQNLIDAVENNSPLRDTLANPVDVVTMLK